MDEEANDLERPIESGPINETPGQPLQRDLLEQLLNEPDSPEQQNNRTAQQKKDRTPDQPADRVPDSEEDFGWEYKKFLATGRMEEDTVEEAPAPPPVSYNWCQRWDNMHMFMFDLQNVLVSTSGTSL